MQNYLKFISKTWEIWTNYNIDLIVDLFMNGGKKIHGGYQVHLHYEQ
jgi:hypothetical protein